MKRFLVLDSFRGLCALAVVFHHFHATQSLTELAFFQHANYLVNFFFVLSGFVLCHIYAERLDTSPQLKRFVIARICRLYPLHIATLLVALMFEGLKAGLEQRGVGFSAASFTGARDPGEILPNLLLVQSWWSGFNPMSFNFPAWSISVEFYLYLLFALIAAALPTWWRQVFLGIATWAFLALYFKSTLLPQGALIGLGCFFSGALTYRLYNLLRYVRISRHWATLLEAVSLLTVMLAVAYSGRDQNISLSLLFCVVVGLFAFEAGGVSTLLRTRLFKWAGTLSFSIYMTHTIILFVLTTGMMVLSKLTGLTLLVDVPDEVLGGAVRYIDTGSLLLDNLVVLTGLAMVLLLSTLTHRYIELPGIELGKYWGRKATGGAEGRAAREPAA
jgi:peptidoglycan/LPS O-acetylase OafA/YrhL